MDIKRAGAEPSENGPADYFTGTVRVDPLFDAPDRARVLGASASFEPGAAMTHIAIVEKLNGKSSDWMEKVSDELYGKE